MPKAFQTELAPQTSHRIYQQLLNVGTASARKCGGLRGKINKRPAFTQLGKLRTATDLECEPLPLQFYNFHYNTPRITDQSVKGEVSDHDFKTQYAPSPCPSLTDNTEEDSMVKMKKIRATSAFARNPESYNRNPELFLSCTPRERRQLNNYKPIIGNQSYQAMRYNKEWSAKVDCRVTKQSSELLKHRADKMYILNGSSLKLQHKYQVNDTEIQHLRELSKARQELKTDLRDAKEIHSRSRNLSALKRKETESSVKLPKLLPVNIKSCSSNQGGQGTVKSEVSVPLENIQTKSGDGRTLDTAHAGDANGLVAQDGSNGISRAFQGNGVEENTLQAKDTGNNDNNDGLNNGAGIGSVGGNFDDQDIEGDLGKNVEDHENLDHDNAVEDNIHDKDKDDEDAAGDDNGDNQSNCDINKVNDYVKNSIGSDNNNNPGNINVINGNSSIINDVEDEKAGQNFNMNKNDSGTMDENNGDTDQKSMNNDNEDSINNDSIINENNDDANTSINNIDNDTHKMLPEAASEDETEIALRFYGGDQ